MASMEAYENDMRKLRRSRKRKRYIKNAVTVGVFIVIVMAIYLSRSLWLPELEGVLQRNFITGGNQEERVESFPIDISRKVNVLIAPMSDCLAIYQDNYLTTLDSGGEELFSSYLTYGSPVILTEGKRALAYDMGGYSFTVITKKSEAFSHRLDDQILYAALGDRGGAAVVTSTDRYPSLLTVYDKNGSKLYSWGDGNYITAAGFSDSEDKIAVSSVYAQGGSIRTTVRVFDIGKREIIAKTDPVETLALGIGYTVHGGFWLIGDTGVYYYDENCSLAYSSDYSYDISSYAIGDGIAAVELSSIDGKSSYVTLYSDSGEGTVQLDYQEKISHIDISGGRVYISTGSRLDCYSSGGILISSYSLGREYNSFAVVGENIYLKSYSSIEKYSLNDSGGIG